MDIEVVRVLEVVRPELPEAKIAGQHTPASSIEDDNLADLLGLIPRHYVGQANLVQAGEESKRGEDNGCPHPLPFGNDLEGSSGLLERLLLVVGLRFGGSRDSAGRGSDIPLAQRVGIDGTGAGDGSLIGGHDVRPAVMVL